MVFLRNILVLSFLFLGACGFISIKTSTTATSSTSQTLVNEGIQFIAALVSQLQSDLAGAGNCSQFQQVLNGLVGTQSCSLEGSEATQVGPINCQDTPTFEGNSTLTFTFDVCRETGQTIDGSLVYDITWDGSLLSVEVFTSDYTHNGVFYIIDDLAVADDGADGPLCLGFVVSLGEVCGVTPDCNFCPL